MNSSKTAETETDRFAKALLGKMQKCSGERIEPKETWREAAFYQRLFDQRMTGDTLPSPRYAFSILDGRKFIDLDDIKAEAGF